MPAMSPLLQSALDEAALLGPGRGWTAPGEAALAEAARLLALTAATPPQQVQVEPDGRIVVEWEHAPRGWLQLSVDGSGTLTHSAVIDGDEYTQAEPFGDALPGWAHELLGRLHAGATGPGPHP